MLGSQLSLAVSPPVATNRAEEGRAKNRRVELVEQERQELRRRVPP